MDGHIHVFTSLESICGWHLGQVALEGGGQTPRLFSGLSLDFQYFEYTTQRELRHNVAKQLCLHARAGTLGLRACHFTGKNSQVPKEEEWELTQVSLLPRKLGIKLGMVVHTLIIHHVGG